MKNPTPKEQFDRFTPFDYPIMVRQKLEKPSYAIKKDFLKVVMDRRSITDISILTMQELSVLLYYSTKIHSFEIDNTGYILTKRTSPSGGARHPVDLLISYPDSQKKRTLSYYNPLDHTLAELMIPKMKLNAFFSEISQNLSIQNACIIWFSIQAAKTGSKYENAESLYWRDAGALLYCIQLIATYLDLKSCPLGTLAANSFPNLFNTSKIISGGGLLLGK